MTPMAGSAPVPAPDSAPTGAAPGANGARQLLRRARGRSLFFVKREKSLPGPVAEIHPRLGTEVNLRFGEVERKDQRLHDGADLAVRREPRGRNEAEARNIAGALQPQEFVFKILFIRHDVNRAETVRIIECRSVAAPAGLRRVLVVTNFGPCRHGARREDDGLFPDIVKRSEFPEERGQAFAPLRAHRCRAVVAAHERMGERADGKRLDGKRPELGNSRPTPVKRFVTGDAPAGT